MPTALRREDGRVAAVHHIRSSADFHACVKEIARELGVADSTLIRAAVVHLANNHPAVPADMAARLEKAHDELPKIQVSGRAVSLLTRPSNGNGREG